MSNLLVEWLKFEEGFRARPYRDTVGVLTVGYGRNLQAHPIPNRDWRVQPATRKEADGWLRDEVTAVYFSLRKHRPLLEEIDQVRAACLINMAFQLGVAGLLGFKRTWRCIEQRDWAKAAANAAASKWARQTPNRARRVCRALESGAWPAEIRPMGKADASP